MKNTERPLCMLLAAGMADCCRCPANPAEFAERQLFPQEGKKEQSRLYKWDKLGTRHAELECCIVQANPAWKAEHIPAK